MNTHIETCHVTTPPAIGTRLQSLTFEEGKTIEVGMEASISLGDTHPAKVAEIRRVKGGYEIDFQEYSFRATNPETASMGHQNWTIEWDKPARLSTIKLDLKGKPTSKTYRRFSLGVARAYYSWEF